MAKIEVIKEQDNLYLVKVGWDYHIVEYDKEADIVRGVHLTEKPKWKKDEPFREAKGFTDESIRAVAKERRQSTARNYFAELCRQKTKGIVGGLSEKFSDR